MEEKIYTTKEFAEAIGISKNHLLKLEKEGKVPPAKRKEKGKISHRYYTVADINEYRKILKMPPILKEKRVQLFLNFKGGTGKTTLSTNYAYALAELGVQVLAIDLDAQRHMTKCLAPQQTDESPPSIYEVLIEDKDINEVITSTKLPTLDIIQGSIKLTIVDDRLHNKEMKEFLLKSALKRINCKEYQIIVIDSLPNMNALNKNAILAANDLLIPVLPDFYSIAGLKFLFDQLLIMKNNYLLYFSEKVVDDIYIFINQHRKNEILSKKSRIVLEKNYSEYLCETIIPYSSKIAQSTAAEMPIFQFYRNSIGAKKIKELVDEILELNQKNSKKGKKRVNSG